MTGEIKIVLGQIRVLAQSLPKKKTKHLLIVQCFCTEGNGKTAPFSATV